MVKQHVIVAYTSYSKTIVSIPVIVIESRSPRADAYHGVVNVKRIDTGEELTVDSRDLFEDGVVVTESFQKSASNTV